jgi:hypothetical protein
MFSKEERILFFNNLTGQVDPILERMIATTRKSVHQFSVSCD